MSRLTPEEYEEKRYKRYLRLKAASLRTEKESTGLIAQAHDMASIIPFGQPILIGHHSEARDRNYRGRIENKFRKGFALYEKSQDLADRAEAAKNNTAIFTDDPAAADKLEERIAQLEQRQDLMKAANKLARKQDRAGLAALGFSETRINDLLTPDYIGRLGFASFEITNNGANLRRLKERLQFIKAHENDTNSEKTICGVQIVDNAEANRLQLIFSARVSRECYAELKKNGFRYSPSVGEFAFQAYRGRWNSDNAERIIKKYFGPTEQE
jgi:Domain of unknown function (DUF3560).